MIKAIALPPLFSSFICFFLLIIYYIYFSKEKASYLKYLALLFGFLGTYEFGQSMIINSNSPQAAFYWSKVKYFGVIMCIPVFLHFVIYLLKRKGWNYNNAVLQASSWLTAIFFLIIAQTGLFLEPNNIQRISRFIEFEPLPVFPLYHLFGIALFFFLLSGIFLLFRSRRDFTSRRDRMQVDLIAIGASIHVLAGGVDILTVLNLTPFPTLTAYGAMLNALLTTIGIVEEISYHKKLAENSELESLFQEQQRLWSLNLVVRETAHEVFNPLERINILIDELRKKFRQNPLTQSLIKSLKEDQKEITKRMERMLQASSPFKLKREKINLSSLISELKNHKHVEAQAKEIEIRLKPQNQDLILAGDASLLKVAFHNLLTNALEHSPRKSQVTIESRASGSEVVLTFQNEGTGIAQDDQNKIFSPYFSTKGRGHGIGLPMCREIFEGHGGRIWVESEKDKGAKFHVALPLEENNS